MAAFIDCTFVSTKMFECSLGKIGVSFVLAVEGPADDETSHFRRSGTDFVELGVTQEAAGRVVVDVTVAAQNLVKNEIKMFATKGTI
jgi:hypothetical protein